MHPATVHTMVPKRAGVLGNEHGSVATALSGWWVKSTRDARMMEIGNMTCPCAEVSCRAVH